MNNSTRLFSVTIKKSWGQLLKGQKSNMTKALINKRLKITQFIGRALVLLPFIRCIVLNGSLASGNHKDSSDIDLLIVSKDGRIFTARFFVNLIGTILFIKRSKSDIRGHAGKFCFNYFLTESYLNINFPKDREKYCADNYSKSQFVAGDIGLFKKFIQTNQALFKKYDCKFQIPDLKFAVPAGEIPTKSQKKNDRFMILQKLGNWFEKWVKKYQIKKIESDPRTHKYPEAIFYNDKELRFHPPKEMES